MKRVYHPYTKWEEYHAGMWKKYPPEKEKEMLMQAYEFTANHTLYGEWMLKAVEAWPFSCEHNLSCRGMNRQAWIGHAAVCLATGIPEHVTRAAWSMLTPEQQTLANGEADTAIAKWEVL